MPGRPPWSSSLLLTTMNTRSHPCSPPTRPISRYAASKATSGSSWTALTLHPRIPGFRQPIGRTLHSRHAHGVPGLTKLLRSSGSLPMVQRLSAGRPAVRSGAGEGFKFDITQVIGLANDDAVSREFRPYKQMTERLNRTFKSTYRVTCGYDNYNGANYNVALWVAYYNFLRPSQAQSLSGAQ